MSRRYVRFTNSDYVNINLVYFNEWSLCRYYNKNIKSSTFVQNAVETFKKKMNLRTRVIII